jgi:hypothetical protein
VYPHATAASLAAKAMFDIENHTVEDLVEVLADPTPGQSSMGQGVPGWRAGGSLVRTRRSLASPRLLESNQRFDAFARSDLALGESGKPLDIGLVGRIVRCARSNAAPVSWCGLVWMRSVVPESPTFRSRAISRPFIVALMTHLLRPRSTSSSTRMKA